MGFFWYVLLMNLIHQEGFYFGYLRASYAGEYVAILTDSILIREMMVKMRLSPIPPPRGRASVAAAEVGYVFTD